MRNGIAGHKFIIVNLLKSTSIGTSLSGKPIFLIIGNSVENAYSVISSPTKKKVFIGIDSRTIFGRLLKRRIKDYIILKRSIEIFFLGGTGCHHRSGNSKV